MTSRWSRQRREKRKVDEYLQDESVRDVASGSTSRNEFCAATDVRATGSSSEIHIGTGTGVQTEGAFGIDSDEEEEAETSNSNVSDSSDVMEEDSYPSGKLTRQRPNDNESSQTRIRDWAIKHQITHSALKELLDILKSEYDPQIPSDPRTLCKTPSGLSNKIRNICGGEYFHFGLKCVLKEFLESLSDTDRATIASIALNINCDGIPLFKSSGKQFWPILVQFCINNNQTASEPVPVGIFLGNSKPNNVKDFLKEFIEEIIQLRDGYEFKSTKYFVSIRCFICDAPARQFLKCIKSHSGYSSCERCQQQGEYNNGTITFPELDAQLRTDTNFASMSDSDHHKGPSPLLQLDVGLVSQFVLDPMHLLYLGVMRKLIHLWLKGPLPTRIGSQSKERISTKLLELAKYMPNEFSRKPRSLNDLERYKATEFRSFLLYTGPVCLLGNIDENIYKNFLLLSVSINLLSVYRDPQNVQVAKKYLTAFIKHFEKLYGSRHLVYNLHNLVHLPDDVSRYGTVDKFSAFPFENYLGTMKRLLRKPNCLLSQVANRIFERRTSRSELKDQNYPITKLEHSDGPLINDSSCKQFRALYLKDYCLRLDCANRGIMVNNQVGKVVNIVQYDTDPNMYVLFYSYEVYEDLYQYPLKSSSVGVYIISHESKTLRACSVKDIQMKYILFPLDNKFAAFPLIHTGHQQ